VNHTLKNCVFDQSITHVLILTSDHFLNNVFWITLYLKLNIIWHINISMKHYESTYKTHNHLCLVPPALKGFILNWCIGGCWFTSAVWKSEPFEGVGRKERNETERALCHWCNERGSWKKVYERAAQKTKCSNSDDIHLSWFCQCYVRPTLH